MLLAKLKSKFFIFLILVIFCPVSAMAEPSLQENLANYISGVQSKYPSLELSFELYDLDTNNKLYSHNSEQALIPASTQKIITTYAALKTLGANYRYQTEFYTDRLPIDNSADTLEAVANAGVGNLYVRGYGDPSLVNEDIIEIAHGLYQKGVRRVKDVVIDDSLFIDPPAPTGEKAYLVGHSAVSLNFNAYLISIAPSSLNTEAFLELRPSAPFKVQNNVVTVMGRRSNIRVSQDPQSGAYKKTNSQFTIGSFEDYSDEKISVVVRGSIGRDMEAEKLYYSVPNPSMYFAQSFKQVLNIIGIKVEGSIRLAEVPAKSKLAYLHKSKYLIEILRDLNWYSNNFVAGQLLYTMGQDSSGYFDQKIALKKLRELLVNLGINSSAFSIHDGSGLNKSNRLSAGVLVKILAQVYADLEIMPDFIASLSHFSATGTLKDRKLSIIPATEVRNQAKQRKEIISSVWGKTGSLDGVSSLAGFLELQNGNRAAYAIIINSVASKDIAIEIEDEIIKRSISSL